METKMERMKKKVGQLFSKSKMRTEEALQITQLNQKLRSLRSEREEGVRKIGEKAFSHWKEGEKDFGLLEELFLMVDKKEIEIARTEQEKEKVRLAFSEKIREVEEEKATPEEEIEEEKEEEKEEIVPEKDQPGPEKEEEKKA